MLSKRMAAGLAVGAFLGAAASARAGAVLPVAGEIGQGTAFAQRGSYLAAELFLKRAIAVDGKVHGPDHPGLAATLDKLATLYQATGRNGAAEPLFVRALAILEMRLPPGHPVLAAIRENYVGCLGALGREKAAAARGQRPPVEDYGPWPEAAERERHGGPSTPAPWAGHAPSTASASSKLRQDSATRSLA
jgi:hypothetical protein